MTNFENGASSFDNLAVDPDSSATEASQDDDKRDVLPPAVFLTPVQQAVDVEKYRQSNEADALGWEADHLRV